MEWSVVFKVLAYSSTAYNIKIDLHSTTAKAVYKL